MKGKNIVLLLITGLALGIREYAFTQEEGSLLNLRYKKGERIITQTKTKSQMEMEVKGKVKMLLGIIPVKTIEEKQSESQETDMEYTDEVLEVENEQPSKIRREIHEVSIKKKTKTSEGEKETSGPPLKDMVFILERDGDTTSVKPVDLKGEFPDLARNFQIDPPIKALLPKKPVKIGDSWVIEEEELKKVISSSIFLGLFEDGKEEKKDGKGEKERKGSGSLSGSGKGELKEIIIDEKGHKCAKIEYQYEITATGKGIGDITVSEDKQESKKEGEMKGELKIKASGIQLFDMEEGKPISDKYQGTFTGEFSVAGKFSIQSLFISLKCNIGLKGMFEGATDWKAEK
jgi:hypothetical protein